jgi:hypothetical protein
MFTCKTTKTCPGLDLKPVSKLEVKKKKLPLRKRSY